MAMSFRYDPSLGPLGPVGGGLAWEGEAPDGRPCYCCIEARGIGVPPDGFADGEAMVAAVESSADGRFGAWCNVATGRDSEARCADSGEFRTFGECAAFLEEVVARVGSGGYDGRLAVPPAEPPASRRSREDACRHAAGVLSGRVGDVAAELDAFRSKVAADLESERYDLGRLDGPEREWLEGFESVAAKLRGLAQELEGMPPLHGGR